MIFPEEESLPRALPIFPLSGVLLLPQGNLPLNIFEPRYLAMVEDALLENHVIGMIQPLEVYDESKPPPLYRTGCVGKITKESKSSDGIRFITLTGISRFDLNYELPLVRGYRRGIVSYEKYNSDMNINKHEVIDTSSLLFAMKDYFEARGLKPDLNAMRQTPSEALVNLLSMMCPFAPAEKQGLLEAQTLLDRTQMLSTLLSLDSQAHETARLMQ